MENLTIPTPLPRVAAFEKLGFGMFVHWGLYSQLGEGEWTRYLHPWPQAEYAKLAETFTAKDFDPYLWAATARRAGMRYITLTTRHHDGFSLYDTCGLNTFDAPHSAAKRDLIKEFVAGCRAEGIVPFFYHTTIDWQWENTTSRDLSEEDFQRYLLYLEQSVEILCTNYGKIGGLWFDGNWARPESDWHEERLYGMIRRHQPDAIIINNTGLSALGKEGHPEIDAVTYENNSAQPMDRRGKAKYIAGEVCKTMNTHWGIGKKDFNFLAPREVIERLCHSRGCGANLLLNLGPEAQGALQEYEKAVLGVVGDWIKMFGEAIYDTKPTDFRCKGRDFILSNGKDYYYFAFDLGMLGDANVTALAKGLGSRGVDNFKGTVKSAVWMDNGAAIPWSQNPEAGMLSLRCDGYPYGTNTVVRVAKLEVEA